jgi:hypothetical protein
MHSAIDEHLSLFVLIKIAAVQMCTLAISQECT